MGFEIHEKDGFKNIASALLLGVVGALMVGCGGKVSQTPSQPNCQPAPIANAGGNKMLLVGLGTSKSVQLGVPAIGGQTYSWSPIDGLDNPNVAQPNASPKKQMTYTLTACTAQCGCVKDDAVVSVYSE